jgi:hypothetical protein
MIIMYFYRKGLKTPAQKKSKKWRTRHPNVIGCKALENERSNPNTPLVGIFPTTLGWRHYPYVA